MAEVQKYRDKKTGEVYTEWIDADGRTVREYEPRPESSSSSHRVEGRHNERHNPRNRRDSTVRPTHRRDSSSAVVNNDRNGDPSEETENLGVRQRRGSIYSSQSSHRHTQKPYHSSGGYNSSQAYEDPSNTPDDSLISDLAKDMHDIGLEGNYAPSTSSPNPPPIPQSIADADPRRIRGTDGHAEKLDKSYQVRNHDYKKFFRVGRVFSTLWTESVGNSTQQLDPTFISSVIYNERVYSKVRRFVVVRYRESDRFCTCLPVTSYHGLGYRKKGIALEEHGFIYSHKCPRRVDGMLSQALKVNLSRGNADLTEPSLVNYGKVYTVETNVKVKDVGDLTSDSRQILRDYFQEVFQGVKPAVGDETPRPMTATLAYMGGAVASMGENNYDYRSSVPRGAAAAPVPVNNTDYSGPIYGPRDTSYRSYTQPQESFYPRINQPTPVAYSGPDTSQYTLNPPPSYHSTFGYATSYGSGSSFQPQDQTSNIGSYYEQSQAPYAAYIPAQPNANPSAFNNAAERYDDGDEIELPTVEEASNDEYAKKHRERRNH